MTFDITHFHHKPDNIYLCQRCYGILLEAPQFLGNGRNICQCPNCECDYDNSERYGNNTALYLTHKGLRINYSDDIAYYQRLASIAHKANEHIKDPIKSNYPPLGALYDALLSAKHFIHFATYGLHQAILGALELASHNNIKVRGVATIPESNGVYYNSICEQIDEDKSSHPNLEIRYERDWNFVHSKFVIIDGLIAFRGTSNLTRAGFMKPNNFLEDLEVVTDFERIRDLNNRLFSQPWIMNDSFNSISMDSGNLYYYDFSRAAGNGFVPPDDMRDIPF